MDLYLDDMRPVPKGWTLAKTVEEAKAFLLTGEVERASLDHDLGACPDCYKAMGVSTPEEWLDKTDYQSMPHCDHFGTGYNLVCWMEETGHWPKVKPKVHSANPVGRARMQLVIDKHFGQ